MSALIFVALAIAWAVYLIPQALKHHEASDSARNVEGFSDRMRVLARREPSGGRGTRLVVQPGRPTPIPSHERPVPAMTAPGPVLPELRQRREAAKAAARRRRRVLYSIVVALIGVGVATGLGYLPMVWLALPAAVLLAWLVACRLMVRKEHADLAKARPIYEGEAVPPSLGDPTVYVGTPNSFDSTEETPVVPAEPVAEEAPAPAPGSWTPVAEVLPTYVDKAPAARRTVRTIDLDGTGVWSSGHAASDSALAREAEESERAERAARAGYAPPAPKADERRRASGS